MAVNMTRVADSLASRLMRMPIFHGNLGRVDILRPEYADVVRLKIEVPGGIHTVEIDMRDLMLKDSPAVARAIEDYLHYLDLSFETIVWC